MRQIFAFQSRGDIPAALRFVDQLDDTLLVGNILADRYLGRYHRSTTNELRDWLDHYKDLPDAPAIHALLRTKIPRGVNLPAAPEVWTLTRTSESVATADDIDPPRNDILRDMVLDRTVLDRAQSGNASSALRLITTTRRITPAYAAQLRAEVAQVLFTRNEDVDALRVAQASLHDIDPADQSSLGYYIGGLAAWRLDRIEVARALFEGGAQAPNTSARLHAASAFWASRAARRMNDPLATSRWLRVAAEERVTLHGMIARRILRMDTGILPSLALLSQADVDAVAATPGGWRAFALLQIDQAGRAEAELLNLWSAGRANPIFGRSLVMVAANVGLANAAAMMADQLQNADGQSRDELRFPMPRLHPAGGFSVDPALVYALTRVESNFDPDAVSPAGARGLMQIMPATAQYITGDLFFQPKRLHEPASNLAIGQRYINYLARYDGIDNDLLRMLACYNSGPGNFARWGADLHDDGDPLMFLEAIPIPETRQFVAHALVYSWIYAARMHTAAPSLDAIAVNDFPRFTPPRFTQAPQERKVASRSPGLN